MMQDQILRELSERIDHLERQNHWLKRAGFLALLPLGAGLILGAARLDDSELILRDPNTHIPRISLSTNPRTGSAGLEIYDRQGRRRIVLSTEPETDQPGLFYFDEEGAMKRQDND